MTTATTVIWFFWILSLGGVEMKESVGQWDNRSDCMEYRLLFEQSYLSQNIPITTSLCARRYRVGV